MGVFKNRRLRKFLIFFFALITGLQIFTALQRQAAVLPHDADELAWFYHADFFRLFVRGDFRNPEWQSLEAYDHPPVTKYLFGAYLLIRSPEYPRDRETFRKTYGSWYDGNIDNFPYEDTVFVRHVQHLRNLNIMGGIAVVMFAAWLLLSLTGNLWLSLIFAYWLGNISSFQVILIRAVSDTQYLLFLLGALLTFTIYLKTPRTKWLLLSAALGALSFSSKLLGGLYFLIVPAFLLLEAWLHTKELKRYIRDFLIIGLVGAGVWIILNPTLYPRPFANTLYYLRMRDSIVRYQMSEPHNMPQILISATRRMEYLSCTFFHTPFPLPCAQWHIFPQWQLNMMLFLYGLYTLCLRAIRRNNRSAFFLITAFVVIVILSAAKLQLAWERYLIVHLVIFSLVSFFGIYNAIRTFTERLAKPGRV